MMRFFCSTALRKPVREVLVNTGTTLAASLISAGAYKIGESVVSTTAKVLNDVQQPNNSSKPS